jgi:tRNA threonylcarbamoyladenosine biosynthesis protein TsaE
MDNITTHSDQQTLDFAQKFVEKIVPGDVLLLHGELGGGKTTFVKGLAVGLGISAIITSPTFTLVRSYDTTHSTIKKLYHLDLYRLKDNDDYQSFGLDEMLDDKSGIVVIEWPEKITLPIKNAWNIYFEHRDGTSRVITVKKST